MSDNPSTEEEVKIPPPPPPPQPQPQPQPQHPMHVNQQYLSGAPVYPSMMVSLTIFTYIVDYVLIYLKLFDTAPRTHAAAVPRWIVGRPYAWVVFIWKWVYGRSATANDE